VKCTDPPTLPPPLTQVRNPTASAETARQFTLLDGTNRLFTSLGLQPGPWIARSGRSPNNSSASFAARPPA
jgi:hypothetical protein